ncbi:dihydrofolate reductase [Haloprofundus salinisoli]|uniref:dihydrofolate reductase n=1 Tax=Haloprofundus salinisoli TaxID=2876193 RepID=UPI001CCF2B74|nr:dihydrofolate reductase [Haloprofundus salinisoli]
MELVLIAAVAENGVIGADGDIPWHYPDDLAHFKRTTTGHPVVVGRRTYESIVRQISGPLPGRTNVVLSRREMDLPDGAVRAASVDAALERASEAVCDGECDEPIFVIGGETVYEQFLPRANRLVLTELHETFEGDTEFPAFDRDSWTEVERDEHDAFDFVEYRRRES